TAASPENPARRTQPTTFPPRTTSRRAAAHPDERGSGSRRGQALEGVVNGNNMGDRPDASGSPARAPGRGGNHLQMPQDPPQRSSSSREGRTTAAAAINNGAAPVNNGTASIPVRSGGLSAAADASSRGPSREGSDVIGRLVVSPPEVDIERERE